MTLTTLSSFSSLINQSIMKNETELMNSSDQSSKPRRPRARQVSSRFLSPSSTSSHNTGIPSPNQALSPIRRKNGTTTTTTTKKPMDTRKHKSLDDSGSIRGLWPSPGIITTSTNATNEKLDTLADHLGNETLKDLLDRKDQSNSEKNNAFSLSRQQSGAKENHRPIHGGSARYTGKFRFPGKSSSSRKPTSTSSSCTGSSSSSQTSSIVPGRFSVDENALNYRRKSDSFIDGLELSGSECSDICSNTDLVSPGIGKHSSASYMSSTVTSRRSGLEVSSTRRPRRKTLERDNIIPSFLSSDKSPKLSKFTLKNAMKRANSLTGYGTTTSQWALSPGRSSSPPVSLENKGKPMSFSNMKPPTSPSRTTSGVEKLLNLGLDLFKSKKSLSSSNLSPVGPSTSEDVHQLRLLHNRLIQWRFVNARGDAVNSNITKQAERNLLYASNSITKVQSSVVPKRLQLQKEKLETKLNSVLHSQVKPLEAWGDVERQHLLALSMTQDCLHSVVCRVPLTDGAKVETQSASMALRHASDLTASIKSMLTFFSPEAEKTVSLISELAEVVAQEKSLLEECFELLSIISTLEIRELSLKCYLIQQHQQQQGYNHC